MNTQTNLICSWRFYLFLSVTRIRCYRGEKRKMLRLLAFFQRIHRGQ